jgi:hypothetical protein
MTPIERVAVSLAEADNCVEWKERSERSKEYWRKLAKAAIAAMLSEECETIIEASLFEAEMDQLEGRADLDHSEVAVRVRKAILQAALDEG